MKPLYKGLLLGLLHVLLVCTLGAKLLHDRATRPRVWIKAAVFDPELPIRGRYLSFSVQVPAEGFSIRSQPSIYQKDSAGKPVIEAYPVPNRADLVLRGQQLIAVANQNGEYWITLPRGGDGHEVVARTGTDYFLGEHSLDPTRREPGDELWIEATIPRKGPPRPLRLGIKHNGELRVLPPN